MKTSTLKNITLPTIIEINLENHIASLITLSYNSYYFKMSQDTYKVLTNNNVFHPIASIFNIAYCDSILHSNKIVQILDSSDLFCFMY